MVAQVLGHLSLRCMKNANMPILVEKKIRKWNMDGGSTTLQPSEIWMRLMSFGTNENIKL